MNDNSFNMNNNSFNERNDFVDVPPTLNEIKPLSNDNLNSAPTMDALGPMNIMPENLPSNNLNDQGPILNNNIDQDLNRNNTFNSVPTNNDYFVPNSNINNIPNTNLESNPVNIESVNTQNNTLENLYQIKNDSLNNTLENINNNTNSSISELPKENPVIPDIIENKNEPTFEISDISLNNESSDLKKAEEDMLDINDVEETKNVIEEKAEKTSEKIVEKFKNLIEELKLEGKNIEFQEFDFDKLYQLIIKIEK